MNPAKTVHRKLFVRRALTGVLALGLVALPACGDDDDGDDVDTPTDSVVGDLPVDTLAPTDTLEPTGTMAPVDSAATDTTIAP